MCGICGIVHRDREAPVNMGAIGAMMDAMIHRGPDDAGQWPGPGIGLGMRRLSIRDIAGGAQPMYNEDKSVVVVFNGEIYNTIELRATLEAKDYSFNTNCDTEVVLRSIEAYGLDAPQHWNGMFAVAAWMAKENALVLVRDRLGIKPLYYVADHTGIAFASELGALMRSGFPLGDIDPVAIDQFLTYLYIPAPDTIYTNAKKLSPGEMITYRDGELKTKRYWQPRYEIDDSWTLDTAAERFRELLRDSVVSRRVSDVPIGAFLSGGMDSSAVVSTLAMASDRPVKTFSIGFDDAHADELHFARAVADRYSTDHTEEIVRPDAVGLVPKIVQRFGEPFADSSALPMWIVSEMARRDVTVALSGDGGDELFAGYDWTRMNHAVAAARYMPRVMRRAADSFLFFMPRGPGLNKLRRFNLDTFMEPYKSFQRRHTCLILDARQSMFRIEHRRAIDCAKRDRFAEHGARAGDISPDDWMLFMDTSMYLPDDILTKVDRMSMAHSLEARVPLLDHRIVEFAATVPFTMKMRGRTTKILMKHALKDRLPRSVMRQRKRGFSIPIHRWMREDLSEMTRDTLLTSDARIRAYLDADSVDRLWREHFGQRENHGHALWALLMLETWLRGNPARAGIS